MCIYVLVGLVHLHFDVFFCTRRTSVPEQLEIQALVPSAGEGVGASVCPQVGGKAVQDWFHCSGVAKGPLASLLHFLPTGAGLLSS